MMTAGLKVHKNDGFTMIEMLVTITILLIVLSSMYAFLWQTGRGWRAGLNAADVTENARAGLNRMSRELKQASQINTANANQLSFVADFGSGPETITYGFSAGSMGAPGTIWRNSPGSVLINDVDSLQFAYFGNDYRCDTNHDGIIDQTELQACGSTLTAKIAKVEININLRTGNTAVESFHDEAWLRNRVF